MNQPMLRWKLSLAETLAFGSTVAIVIVFAFGNFSSKTEAQAIERRVENLEKQMGSIRDDVSAIRASTEYVKGRIESSNIGKER
jgi:hypothetical protein